MPEITLPADVKSISAATDFINARLEALDCPFKAQAQMDVALDEILSNVALYAYGSGSGEFTLRFEWDRDRRTARVTVIDAGRPFNPLEQQAPDVTLPIEERTVGGLGIHIVRKTMDAVRYARQNGKNLLTLEKRL